MTRTGLKWERPFHHLAHYEKSNHTWGPFFLCTLEFPLMLRGHLLRCKWGKCQVSPATTLNGLWELSWSSHNCSPRAFRVNPADKLTQKQKKVPHNWVRLVWSFGWKLLLFRTLAQQMVRSPVLSSIVLQVVSSSLVWPENKDAEEMQWLLLCRFVSNRLVTKKPISLCFDF